MRKYRNYTDNDIINGAKQVKSLSGLLKLLDLKEAGGNFSNMRRNLQRLNVNCEHWTGSAWSKDKQLKDWSQYTKSVNLKKHLILLRGHKCENCLNTLWLDNPIPLEIHHLDGDRTNNNLNNLSLVCCNCHSLTPNFRNRKR